MNNNEEQVVTTESSQVETDDLSNMYILLGRESGCSLKLRGKVVLITFLVNDGESKWDSASEKAAVEMLKSATKRLMSESGLNKKEFQVAYAYCKVNIPYILNRSTSKRCVIDILRLFGYDSVQSYQKHYEERFSRDETAVTLLFNKDFRSFAQNIESDNTSPCIDEYSITSFDKNNLVTSERTFLHELFHQFGAIDYYYPEFVKIKAQKIFPDSIMNSGGNIDDLTRYLIGWDDELSDSAKEFLNAIKDIPREDIEFSRIEEWKKD